MIWTVDVICNPSTAEEPDPFCWASLVQRMSVHLGLCVLPSVVVILDCNPEIGICYVVVCHLCCEVCCVYELCYLWISQTNNIKLYPEISVARREEDKQIITMFKSDLICVQETKMASMDAAIITNCLGRDYEENFKFLPADDIMRGEGAL
jgi:hypothetical protein